MFYCAAAGDAQGDGSGSHKYRKETWFALMVLDDEGPAVPGRIDSNEPEEPKRKEREPGPVH